MKQHFRTTISQIWRLSANALYKTENLASNASKRKIYKVKDDSLQRIQYLISHLPAIMEPEKLQGTSLLSPPASVRGMTTLNKEAFTKTVEIPGLLIPKKEIQKTQKYWKSQQFRRRGIRPVAELGESDPLKSTHSIILLDPGRLVSNPFKLEAKEKLGLDSEEFKKFAIDFTYDNWTAPEIMRAVLPCDADNVSSFTQIGHIAHLNLREESMPYKELIGQVILDKNSSVDTVVNKVNSIDNTFRNFQMELLAGEDNYVTQLREHGCAFELDFSKVYWNSRLSSEHHRIVESTEKGSVVYDVFAGIGPFAVPLAKKKHCTVFANDLNPSSYEFLKKNIELNKIDSDHIKAFNMDGRDFIRSTVKDHLSTFILKQCESLNSMCDVVTCSDDPLRDAESDSESKPPSGSNKEEKCLSLDKSDKQTNLYIVMNLPGLAIEFLDAFNSLLKDISVENIHLQSLAASLPTVHCYTFEQRSDTMEEEVRLRAESALGASIPGDATVRWVRNVAPKKEMLCLSFKLWPELLLGDCLSNTIDANHQIGREPENKKQKLSS